MPPLPLGEVSFTSSQKQRLQQCGGDESRGLITNNETMLFDGIDDGSSDRSKALRNAVKQVTDPMILNELMNTPTILSPKEPGHSINFEDRVSPAPEKIVAPIIPQLQQPKNLLQSRAKVGGKKQHKEQVMQ